MIPSSSSSPTATAAGPAPVAPWSESIKSGSMIWMLAVFMASPPFSTWNRANIESSRAADFLRLCHNPLTRDLTEGMLAYRVATPALAWLLHLPPVLSLALPYLLSLCALVVIHRTVSLRGNGRLASLATIGVACSSTFLYTYGCLGYADALTHLCSAVALIGSAPLAALAVLIGCLNDERALLALPFIALWRCPADALPGWKSPRARTAWLRASAPLIAGFGAALVVRHALTAGWIGPGIPKPSLYREIANTVGELKPWLESWGVWFVNWLKGPGWLWLLLLPPLVSSRWRPAPLPAFLLGAAFVLVCLSTFIVADVARSIGFAFPAALLCCVWMHEREPATAEKLALLVACLQVATPAVWIYQKWQWLQFRPFPWECWLFLHNSR